MSANTTTLTRRYVTEFGTPILDDDALTSVDWWNAHPDAEVDVPDTIVGTLNYDSAFATTLAEPLPDLIEADLIDDGQRVWLTPEAVVRTPFEHGDAMLRAVTENAERMIVCSKGWTRIHPSIYGVDVDSFHEVDGEPSPHSAQDAWRILDGLVGR